MGGGCLVGMEHDLHDPLTVAQVDERDTAVVTAVGDPAAERHLGARVLGSELPARMAPHRGREHRALAHAATSPETRSATASSATVSCVPSVIRRSVTVPAASSSSPRIAAYRAAERSACFSCAFNGRSS